MPRHWDPIRDLMLLQDRMNQLFEDATERRARDGGQTRDEIERADWIPFADVYEHPQEYVVVLDLPGIDREALEINLENERLLIKGARATANGDRSRSFARPSRDISRRHDPLYRISGRSWCSRRAMRGSRSK